MLRSMVQIRVGALLLRSFSLSFRFVSFRFVFLCPSLHLHCLLPLSVPKREGGGAGKGAHVGGKRKEEEREGGGGKKEFSDTGTRTRVAWVKAKNDNHLHHIGDDHVRSPHTHITKWCFPHTYQLVPCVFLGPASTPRGPIWSPPPFFGRLSSPRRHAVGGAP